MHTVSARKKTRVKKGLQMLKGMFNGFLFLHLFSIQK